MSTGAKTTEASHLAEYDACLSTIQHLDTLNWTAGSLLFGGSIAATAIVFQEASISGGKLLAVSLLSTVLLVCWLAFVWRNTGIARICAGRMVEIEKSLNIYMQHHVAEAREKGSTDIGGKTFGLFGLRGFDILRLMVLAYLVVLWLVSIAISRWICVLCG